MVKGDVPQALPGHYCQRGLALCGDMMLESKEAHPKRYWEFIELKLSLDWYRQNTRRRLRVSAPESTHEYQDCRWD